VGDRPPTVLRWLAGHGQDRRHFFGGELAGTAAARQIAQQLLDGLDQDALGLEAFHQDQAPERVRPAAPPNADRMAFTDHSLGDLLTVVPLECQEDHPGALGHPLGTGAGTRHSDQHLLLAFGDRDLGGSAWHRSSLLNLMETGAVQEGMAKIRGLWKIESAVLY